MKLTTSLNPENKMSASPDAVRRALLDVVAAVLAAVKAAGPMGAPGGILYTALMTQGCTMTQFTVIMDTMVRSGMLQKQGEVYKLGVGL